MGFGHVGDASKVVQKLDDITPQRVNFSTRGQYISWRTILTPCRDVVLLEPDHKLWNPRYSAKIISKFPQVIPDVKHLYGSIRVWRPNLHSEYGEITVALGALLCDKAGQAKSIEIGTMACHSHGESGLLK